MNSTEIKFLKDLKTGCIVEGDFFEALDENKLKNFLENLSNLLNNFSFKVGPIVEEISKDRFSSGYFYEISIFWVAYLYRCFKENNFDLRNEESVKKARIIYEEIKIDNGYYLEKVFDIQNLKDENYLPERVVYHMSREHKTLQQVFTKMVFFFLANKSYPSLKKDFKDLVKEGKLPIDFWNLPLI